MSLRAALELFIQEYPSAMTRPFAKDAVASFISNEVPEIVSSVIQNDRYIVEGSAGKGRWALVPWVAVFDSLVTDSAQDGFYIVYLVKEDFSGVYLSLNQGVTLVRERYHGDAKKALSTRAADFVARLGAIPNGFTAGNIDLAVSGSSSLGAYYQTGAIISRLYSANSLPSEDELTRDLLTLVVQYAVLVDRELPSSSSLEQEDDEVHFEDLTKIRAHKRIERNQKLARKVKKLKGFRCEACGFRYESSYHGMNTDYIEAHHLTPLAGLTGTKIALDPVKDFAVLCADCHRMIHRSEFVHDVAAFRNNHLRAIIAKAAEAPAVYTVD